MTRILILDDNPDMLSMLADLLRLASYEVDEAHNGEEGLRVIQKILPDLILSDARMPVMDGWEFLRQVRAKPDYNHIPFIIFSGDSDDQERASQNGADAFLMKPFRQEVLERLILHILAEK